MMQILKNCILQEKSERQNIVTRKWIKLGDSYWKISEYLQDINVHFVAIYGMGFLGEQLYHALAKTEKIDVVCGLDKNAANIQCELPVYSIDDCCIPMENLDAVIISNVYSCGDIVKAIRKKYNEVEIILLEEILDYII